MKAEPQPHQLHFRRRKKESWGAEDDELGEDSCVTVKIWFSPTSSWLQFYVSNPWVNISPKEILLLRLFSWFNSRCTAEQTHGCTEKLTYRKGWKPYKSWSGLPLWTGSAGPDLHGWLRNLDNVHWHSAIFPASEQKITLKRKRTRFSEQLWEKINSERILRIGIHNCSPVNLIYIPVSERENEAQPSWGDRKEKRKDYVTYVLPVYSYV